MDDASLAALNEAIRDQDAQWEAELQNPELRRKRLRREYVADVRWWSGILAVVWTGGLVLVTGFDWAPGPWGYLGGSGASLVWQIGIAALLFFFTVGVAAVLARRRTEYRALLASPPPTATAPAARPRPTRDDLPAEAARRPPPPDD
jgi:uncharacterized membrane protein